MRTDTYIFSFIILEKHNFEISEDKSDESNFIKSLFASYPFISFCFSRLKYRLFLNFSSRFAFATEKKFVTEQF